MNEILYDSYIKKSWLPKRFINDVALTPDRRDVDAFKSLGKFRDNICDRVNKGDNLLIYSKFAGNGKTTWAAKIAREYVSKVCDYNFDYPPVFFVNIAKALNLKKLSITDQKLIPMVNELEANIMFSDLVIFDDLGIKELSSYDINQLYVWIDGRTADMKSSIYTTNLTPDDLKTYLDQRLYDRILGYSEKVELVGNTRRPLTDNYNAQDQKFKNNIAKTVDKHE